MEKRRKNKKGINWIKWQTIATFTLAVIAVVSLLTAWDTAREANDISKRALELLPSKYAELRITTYIHSRMNFELKDLMNNQASFFFFVENIGGKDSGLVEITINDTHVNGAPIEFQNIGKGQINSSILRFNPNSLENPEIKLLQRKNITIDIRCTRCEKRYEQKTFDICMYNQSVNECFI